MGGGPTSQAFSQKNRTRHHEEKITDGQLSQLMEKMPLGLAPGEAQKIEGETLSPKPQTLNPKP